MSDKLMTKQQASAYLAISARTLDRFRQKRLVAVVKVGKVVRFQQSELDEFLKRHKA